MAYIFLILSKYELFHANGKPLLTDDLMQFETNHGEFNTIVPAHTINLGSSTRGMYVHVTL